MKRIILAAGFVTLVSGMIGCSNAGGNDTGHAYMPDMYYSRAYETYNYNDVGGELDSLRKRGISYNAMPVPGTVARGDVMSYHLTADSVGMHEAEGLRNPLDSAALTKGAMTEAERLYLINCAICHGTTLEGNGPIVATGAYPGVPANLKSPTIAAYPDGHYFHVMTFGIRTMGSYASQLTPQQRWWVIKYIRSKQGNATAKSATDSSGAKPGGTAAAASGMGAKPDSTKQ
jgi:mono/diheme cytochrome c family protein